ncbi:MAG TPA: hypothetical protein VK324_15880 [Tepidisphaeraceae bacterium]|nr:hypothetical protein [Tepidisphaeraceae bacterium]
MSNILVLAANDLNTVKDGYGGLVFMGVFFLALIVFGGWWLSRG